MIRLRTLGSLDFRKPLVLSGVLVGTFSICWAIAGNHSLIILFGALYAGGFIIALGQRVPDLFLISLGTILAGYAFMGKGFAYLGVPPLYVGECALILAVVSIAFINVRRLPWSGLQILLLIYIAWGLCRTVPFIPVYGVNALRDAVDWTYAIFAVVIPLVLRKYHIQKIIPVYASLIIPYLTWSPISTLLNQLGVVIPQVPGTDVSFVTVKGGEVAVHLAGIFAFVLFGLYARQTGSRRELLVWPLWLAGFAVRSIGRGSLLALLSTSVVTLLLLVRSRSSLSNLAPRNPVEKNSNLEFRDTQPIFAKLIPLVFGTLFGAMVLAAWNPQISTGGPRTYSVGQLATNVTSLVSSGDENTDGTKEWRIIWWDKIIDYTFHGPYFWTGKGNGINLRVADSMPGPDDLRAPHSAHFNILGRTGVPGLALWVAIQVAFGHSMIRSFVLAHRKEDHFSMGLVAWITAYWLAALVVMSFDPYLEGPQGGILFWSMLGMGIALRSWIEHSSAASNTDNSFAAELA